MKGGSNKDKGVCPEGPVSLPDESLRISPNEFLEVKGINLKAGQESEHRSEILSMEHRTRTNSDFGMEGGSNKDKDVCPQHLPDRRPVLPHQFLGISANEFLKVKAGQESEHRSESLSMEHRTRTNSNFGRDQASSEQATTCIYKVPEELRTLKESAYKPRVVSIGPIHSNDKRLDAMEQIKLSYRDSFCSKYMSETQKQSCLTAMERPEFEARVKTCYADKIELTKKENQQNDSSPKNLAQMMFDDGCFIIELLLNSYHAKDEYEKLSVKKNKKRNGDPIFGSPMRLRAVRHDLLLLENQIPFFVLEELFKFAVPGIPNPSLNKDYLIRYVLLFFGNILRHGGDTLEKKGDPHDYHILDVLHKCYLPVDDPPDEEKEKTRSRFPSASDLDLAGVQFVKRDEEDLFAVDFVKPQGLLGCCSRAHFEIPTLSIYDDTEPLLRNLIAFEQCCPNVRQHISSYGFFMDTLINSAHDVELLEKAEILHNYLGTSQDVSDLFNNICKEVVVEWFYFEKTCEDADNHCRKLWPRFLASFRRDYFSNPWTGIAVVAAIIIFGLTIVQSIYTVLPYYTKK
ncbi:UPF0481 protein [Camellia lanceoleosa]|uniref:UPF0481 protein n=1 Tax=Camellia lanceoleosa TaxID=1840588 RepID=A0ACC0GNM5_9ERIC|nr:UPF0481 protein [Camellia lanceoleosa]